MTNQVIPVQAVEAAAKEIYRVAADLAYEADTWDDLSENQRKVWIDDAKRILEAAAPNMLGECEAEALEDAAAAFPSYGPERKPADAITWLNERAALIRKGVHP